MSGLAVDKMKWHIKVKWVCVTISMHVCMHLCKCAVQNQCRFAQPSFAQGCMHPTIGGWVELGYLLPYADALT